MRTAILGVGNIGGTLARHLARASHEVVLAGAGPRSATGLAAEIGAAATAAPDAVTAVEAGDLVVLATPAAPLAALLRPLRGVLAGKVVVDATNPYGVVRGAPQGAWLAAQLPGALVVRAFNTLSWETLRDAAFRTGPDRVAVPVSGDDPAATALVAELAAELGFAPVVLGDLSGSTRQDPGGELYAVELPEQRMRSLVALDRGTGAT